MRLLVSSKRWMGGIDFCMLGCQLDDFICHLVELQATPGIRKLAHELKYAYVCVNFDLRIGFKGGVS